MSVTESLTKKFVLGQSGDQRHLKRPSGNRVFRGFPGELIGSHCAAKSRGGGRPLPMPRGTPRIV
jgi:hypothetical protein